MDNFRTVFKQYKRKRPPPDFSNVVDLKKFSLSQPLAGVNPIQLTEPDLPQIHGLLPVTLWKAYTLTDHPGFVFISSPFVNRSDRYWVKRCVEDYSRPPHHSNLDSVMGHGLWQAVCFNNISLEDKQQLDKLHWVTLGIHHDWNTKVYCEDDLSPMPTDLCLLTQYIAAALGFTHFCPQAAILNYYHLTSNLGGHTDHSELDLSAPLISISFGCSAIFLLGGATKAVTPSALFVDNGDIVVMSGPSRLSYHAVPRILTDVERSQSADCMSDEQNITATSTKANWMNSDSSCSSSTCSSYTQCQQESVSLLNADVSHCLSTLNWSPFSEFLTRTRLNINVRQVFHINV